MYWSGGVAKCNLVCLNSLFLSRFGNLNQTRQEKIVPHPHDNGRMIDGSSKVTTVLVTAA